MVILVLALFILVSLAKVRVFLQVTNVKVLCPILAKLLQEGELLKEM